ncbi:MAG: hypothetical protein IKK03_05320 [Lachnospiraceae bacterium]|nr:hypothetical protein [Lachnospiraceae bacterium]
MYWKKRTKNTNSFYSFFNGSSCGNVFGKRIDAFVTIEYSLLLPGIMAVFTMLVCMGLYLHNQCVLQTNIYILSIEGAGMYADNAEHRLTSLQKIEAGLYKEKYILTEDMQTAYRLRGNNIIITGSGKMANPFWVFGVGEMSWKLNAESNVNIISPCETLLLIKSAFKLVDRATGEEEGADEL